MFLETEVNYVIFKFKRILIKKLNFFKKEIKILR